MASCTAAPQLSPVRMNSSTRSAGCSIPFRLLTNNSQRARRDVVAKLARMGIDVEDEHIFTSAMATARGSSPSSRSGTAFVIGEGGC